MLRVPLESDGGTCVVRFDGRPHAVPTVVTDGENPDPRVLGMHFTASRTGREDRLRRLAAVAPAHGDRQLHPRLARRPCRGRGGRARDRRVRAHEPAGKKAIQAALDGHPGRAARSGSSRSRTPGAGLEPAGRPAVERFLGRDRRPPLLRLDVPAAARGHPGDDDPRPRPAALSRSGCTAARAACTRRSTANAARTCDLVFANSAFTARDVVELLGVPARARARRPPRASTRSSRPTARTPTSAARTCSPSRRSSRARTSARSSRRMRCSAATTSGWRSSAPRAGASSRSSTAGHRPARLRRRRRARPALSRCGRVRLPVALRGLRPPGDRGDGLRRARSSARRTPRSTRPAATPPCGSIPRARRRSPRRSRGARRRDELCARGLEHARASPGARTGESSSPRYSRLRDAGRPRRLAARPDAGRHGALREDARRDRATSTRPLRPAAPGRRDCLPRRVWYPALCRDTRARRLDVLHCPTFRGPFRAPRAARRHRSRPRRPAPPGAFNRWTRRYSRVAVPRVVRAAPRVIAVSEFTQRELVELLGMPRSGSASSRTAVERRLHARRAGGRGRLRARGRHARAAQEPRARRSRRARPASSCASSARAAGAASTSPATSRSACRPTTSSRALPRRRLRRLPVALRGLRHPVAEAHGLRHARRDERGGATEEIAGGAAVLVDPLDAASIAAGSRRRSRARRAAPPRPRARPRLRWDEAARATRRVYEEVAA